MPRRMNQNGCIFGGESARPTGKAQKALAPMDDFPPIFCDECASPVRHLAKPANESAHRCDPKRFDHRNSPTRWLPQQRVGHPQKVTASIMSAKSHTAQNVNAKIATVRPQLMPSGLLL